MTTSKYPVKRTVIIRTAERWDCGLGHNHTTKEIALSCIKTHDRPKRNVVNWTREEYFNVLLMRERDGLTFSKIGTHYGLSSGRIAQVYAKACRMRRRDITRLTGIQFKWDGTDYSIPLDPPADHDLRQRNGV